VTAPRLEIVPVGPLACNCSILIDEQAREAVVVDPGDEPERILRALEGSGVRTRALLHTHGHFDHIGGTRGVAEATGAPIRIHEGDRPLYDALAEQARFFGLRADSPLPPGPPLADGERIAFGKFALRAIHTPGHTPGSTCFLLEGSDAPRLFSGDTLFHRSIGRTDLWGGDMEQILASIRERLFSLPDDLPVVCGHHDDTTIGEEKRLNPFVGLAAGRRPL
jgi:glyoxylase-like metal-dependent hydrolase (beta-lactamase superfamily II)